jgi:hypothetical protein
MLGAMFVPEDRIVLVSGQPRQDGMASACSPLSRALVA